MECFGKAEYLVVVIIFPNPKQIKSMGAGEARLAT
jgi:hypothetical protein